MLDKYIEGSYRIAKLAIDIASDLKDKNEAILVFLHRSVDGDCVGSATGLVSILRKLGANAYVAMGEKLPDTMKFLDVNDLLFYPDEAFISNKVIDGKKVTRAFSVDCTEGHRMVGNLGAIYDSFEDNLTIDHHEVTHLANEFKWIVPGASSACELIYYFAEAVADLVNKDIGEIIDSRAAQGILAGIVTDTGRFTYSNTCPETLSAASILMQLGGRIGEICYNLFDLKTKSEFLMSNAISSEAEFYYDNKLAVATANQEQFRIYSAEDDAISDVVSKLRDVDGVIFAVVLRETSDGNIRGNLRSKGDFDCIKLASVFDGGGHKNASGFTIKAESGLSMDDVKNTIIDKVKDLL